MAANADIFDVIEQLTQSLPLEPVKVAEILNTRLEDDPEDDSPVQKSYLQPEDVADSRYESVELRIPDPLLGTDGGLLSATLKDNEGIGTDAIFQKFGLKFKQDVPSPRCPSDTPVYYNYEQPWGTLSLGVTNDDDDKLVAFILKPNEIELADDENESAT